MKTVAAASSGYSGLLAAPRVAGQLLWDYAEPGQGVAVDDHSAETNGRAGGSEPVARKLRKPYSKPSFRSEQVFETMALACGKLAGTGGSCNHVKKDS